MSPKIKTVFAFEYWIDGKIRPVASSLLYDFKKTFSIHIGFCVSLGKITGTCPCPTPVVKTTNSGHSIFGSGESIFVFKNPPGYIFRYAALSI